jgi:stage V sporulation protein G
VPFLLTVADCHSLEEDKAPVVNHIKYVLKRKTLTINKGKIMNYMTMKKAELVAKINELVSTIKNSNAGTFDCLNVTNVQVYPFKEGPSLGHIKGMATVVLNDQMMIRGLRIMDGENGLFVSYPCDPFYKGEDFRSLCNPITRQLREHIENVVLEKYQASIAA